MLPSSDVQLTVLRKVFRAIASALANEFIISGFPAQIDAHLSPLPSGIDNSPELPMALTGGRSSASPPMLSQQHSFKREPSPLLWGQLSGGGLRFPLNGAYWNGYTASLVYTKALAGAKLSTGAS